MEHSSFKSVVNGNSERNAIHPEVALRIAMAARELPEVDLKDFLAGIISLLGEPLTVPKLTKLRVSNIRKMDCLEDVDLSFVKQALEFLKGKGIDQQAEPLPQIEQWTDDSEHGSIMVACASNSGDFIDGHFGSCARFLIYRLSQQQICLTDIRVPGLVEEGEDKNALRALLLADCQVLYTVSIGGPAAAKVVRAGLHPVKVPGGGKASDILLRLQQTLAVSPPPWLAKAMGKTPEERIRFRQEVSA